MLSLLSEIHFWTIKDDINVKNTDYGVFKYNQNKDTNNHYDSSKKSYCERRGVSWSLTNKRPHKLKDKLKELEDYLSQSKIVCVNWKETNIVLLLAKGVLVNITYNRKSCDLISITFDKFLTSKVQNELISDGCINGDHVIAILTDGRVFGFGGSWRDGWSIEGGPRRHVYLQSEFLAVWGRTGAEHPQPWSPLTKDHQRANLHMYWVGSRGPDLLSYKKTAAEPITVVISKIYSKNLIVVEQKVSQRGAVSVEVNVLELISNTLKRASVTAVPLQTQVCSSSLSKNEIFLLLCCIDGTVALLDRNRGSTKIVKASFIPTLTSWHESSSLAVIGNERGQIQYIDTSLNFLKTQISAEDFTPNALIDISSYFNIQPTISLLDWGSKDLIVCLEHGPVAVITHNQKSLSFLSMVQRYLRDGKPDKAVNLMLSWEFNEDCFNALQKVVTYLLRLPLTEENARLLQNALGSYYSPPVPLDVEVAHNYGFQVKCLTRRFFHQLVRSSMFETAFLLAVDIGHHDLFMDLHYIAVKLGETEMAAAARAQASTLLSRCSSAGSECSRSSCSQCSDTTSSSSNEDLSLDEHPAAQPQKTISSHNDNYLTTNFNNSNPKTYSTYIPPIPNIDLPKITFNKPTMVKPPQVPNIQRPLPNIPPLPVTAPPFPVAPPLVNNPTFQSPHFSYSIPFSNQPKTFGFGSSRNTFSTGYNFPPTVNEIKQKPIVPPPLPNQSHLINAPLLNQPFNNVPLNPPFNNGPLNPPFNNGPLNPSFNNGPLNSPLNPSFNNIPLNPSFNNVPLSNFNVPYTSSYSNASSITTSSPVASTSQGQNVPKKGQAKVKFSDTVTAFIVPEIKRPVRPSLPAHVMDPQKELADSLPLCHPNEDYLKDFAPVKKGEVGENPGPKIKVVHFGVV